MRKLSDGLGWEERLSTIEVDMLLDRLFHRRQLKPEGRRLVPSASEYPQERLLLVQRVEGLEVSGEADPPGLQLSEGTHMWYIAKADGDEIRTG